MIEPTVALIEPLVSTIHPLLAGQPPVIQGAALADLLATWLAGHFIPDDADATAELREELLRVHIECVRALIPPNERLIHGKSV